MIQISVPPGVDNGTRLRVPNEGEPGIGGAQNGDLIVVIRVAEHDIFKRDGLDLHVELPVDMITATIGGTVEVPTISGLADLKIPPGTQHGKVLRMRGKGVPSLRGQGRGDQYVHIRIVIPEHISSSERSALEDIRRQLNADKRAYPAITEFQEKIKRRYRK